MNEDERLYTFKEIADELKITKNTVAYRAGKLPDEMKKQIDGVRYVTEDGKRLIYEMKPPREDAETSQDTPQATETNGATVDGQSATIAIEALQSALDALKGELYTKQAEITKLHDEIATLQTLLSQAQQLQAAQITMQKDVEPEQKKNGLFSFFRR